MNLKKIIQKIESENPAVGIGTAAGVQGILAASMIIKIANIRKFPELKTKTKKVKKRLKQLIELDSKAFNDVMKAYKTKDKDKIQYTWKIATEKPWQIAQESYKLMEIAEDLLDKGENNLKLEAYGAVIAGKSAVISALEIVEANLRYVKDKNYFQEMQSKRSKLYNKTEYKEAMIRAKHFKH